MMSISLKPLSALALLAVLGLGAATLASSEASAQSRHGWGGARAGGWAGGGWAGGGRPAFRGDYGRHRGGGWGPGAAAGVVGGLALGALAAGAFAAPPPPAYYGAPIYEAGPACELARERVWDGYRWRLRTVEICD